MTLEDILEPDGDVGSQYDVTQPSILKAIGAVGTIRRATVIKDCLLTITCRQDRTPAQVIQRPNGKYRYLTERECFRAMGFTDAEFEAAERANPVQPGKLNRTLYKQAGNSMPVPVLASIFKQVLPYIKG